jgi:excisionase family DNA binding protein
MTKPTMAKAAETDRPRYARIREACEYSNISRTTLYELIHAGKIEAKKGGRHTTWVDLDSVDRYFADLPKLEKRAI